MNRDIRWEDMYAEIQPLDENEDPVVRSDQETKFFKYRIQIWYNGGYYWQSQIMWKEDVTHINVTDVEVFRWLWDEMVKLTDERLDAGITS